MKIIIDAMGGDNAPGEIVKGAVDAQREFGVDIILVGKEKEVRDCLRENGVTGDGSGITVVNAEEIVTMHDDPSTAVRRKKDSSMAVALRMLHDGEGDACISAGSTGALLTGATLLVKRISGIRRAAMAPVYPNGGKGVLLIDCGANVECTPEYLLQFAYMGSFYASKVMGCAEPKIGLLNIGSEETKGTELCRETYAILKAAGEAGRINFAGNIEGNEFFSGKADVVVADGFSGNIFLKTSEGVAKFVMSNVKDALLGSKRGKVAAMMIKKDLAKVKAQLDSSEVGGTAMLGISKPVIKAHGGSNARAIRSAVKQAISFVNANITQEIADNIEYMKLKKDEEA